MDMAAPPAATRRWNVDQLVADRAARRDALEGGRLDDAVAQGQRAEGRRGEDRRARPPAGAAWHGPTFADRRAGRTLASAPPALPVAAGPGPGAAAGRRRRSATCGSCVRPPGRRRARRVADGERGQHAAGGADGARDEHGGPEPGGQRRRLRSAAAPVRPASERQARPPRGARPPGPRRC